MKFAHELQEILTREGFPPEWTASAIPYAKLKKLLKKVQAELESLGLDRETLSQLTLPSDQSTERRGSGVAIQYEIDGKIKLVPRLTLFIQVEGGDKVDAVLSPETKEYLEHLAAQQPGNAKSQYLAKTKPTPDSLKSEKVQHHAPDRPGFKRVEVPLTFDAEFFDMLYDDVAVLDAIQTQQQQALVLGINRLSTQLVHLAQPSAKNFKDNKSDLYRWRQLFEIYLQGAIFFSTHEKDHGSRDSASAARQLNWFQDEVVKRGLASTFVLPESRQALVQFVNINIELLRNLKFLEINQKAVSKIIKKFDKRTQLGAAKTFPKLIQSDAIMSGSMAKALCAQVTQDVVKIVPQLDDYLCPICCDIVWRPVRMRCAHVFCSACAVKMERQKKKCPLCRENVLVNLMEDDIDGDLINYLELWFPVEVRAKKIAIETEAGRAELGIHYKHPTEEKCAVM